MARALSLQNIADKKYDCFDLSPKWKEVFGEPERKGIWIIWGPSGGGKTSFAWQLMKELSNHDKIMLNSLEEGVTKIVQDRIFMYKMLDTKNPVMLDMLNYDELIEKLSKKGSPRVVFTDSLQYLTKREKQFFELKKRFPNKLFVFISQNDKSEPKGNIGMVVKQDALLKIYVEGFRAFNRGRTFGEKEHYTIADLKAEEYHS